MDPARRPEHRRGAASSTSTTRCRASRQLPDFDSLTPRSTGTAATFDISFRQRQRGLRVPLPRRDPDRRRRARYTFYTSSDGREPAPSRRRLSSSTTTACTRRRSARARCISPPGSTTSRSDFLNQGEETLAVSLEGPGIPKQLIPPNRLFPTVPVPVENDPPTLANPGMQSAGQRDPVSLALAATDPDGDDLWFEARGLPPGVALDRETGAISGAPSGARPLRRDGRRLGRARPSTPRPSRGGSRRGPATTASTTTATASSDYPDDPAAATRPRPPSDRSARTASTTTPRPASTSTAASRSTARARAASALRA